MKKFTLIELLVVISIISVLASLLIPGLGRARKAARVGVCISNLSNITKAAFMYLDDNDSTFSGSTVHGGQGHGSMPMEAFVGKKGLIGSHNYDADYKMTNPYLGSFTGDDEVPVAHCPLDEAPLATSFTKGDCHYDAVGSSYGSNARKVIGGKGQDLRKVESNPSANGVNLNEISTESAQMVMIIPYNAWHVAWDEGGTNGWQTAWHPDNKFGLSFIDGHVKNQKIILGRTTTSSYNLLRDDP